LIIVALLVSRVWVLTLRATAARPSPPYQRFAGRGNQGGSAITIAAGEAAVRKT
jgi:hypothetical protein